MRILVCGGRHYENEAKVHEVLDELTKTAPPCSITIIQGGAPCTDHFAVKWAYTPKNAPKMQDLVTYHADWQQYGKKAGPVRNGVMLKDSQPDIVVAFPGGAGTAHMIEIASKAGIKVIKVDDPSHLVDPLVPKK
jgi:hypothetical protein